MLKQVSYSQAIVRKYPEQIVIAIARDAQGKYNPITLGWTMIVSSQPPMMAIAIGKTRYSLEAIRQAKEFVIAFPSEDQKDETMLFGTKSGKDTDKLAEAGTAVTKASMIDCVLMNDAAANFECKLVSEIETGDHITFFGQIVCSHVNAKLLNRLYTVDTGYKMRGLPRG